MTLAAEAAAQPEVEEEVVSDGLTLDLTNSHLRTLVDVPLAPTLTVGKRLVARKRTVAARFKACAIVANPCAGAGSDCQSPDSARAQPPRTHRSSAAPAISPCTYQFVAMHRVCQMLCCLPHWLHSMPRLYHHLAAQARPGICRIAHAVAAPEPPGAGV